MRPGCCITTQVLACLAVVWHQRGFSTTTSVFAVCFVCHQAVLHTDYCQPPPVRHSHCVAACAWLRDGPPWHQSSHHHLLQPDYCGAVPAALTRTAASHAWPRGGCLSPQPSSGGGGQVAFAPGRASSSSRAARLLRCRCACCAAAPAALRPHCFHVMQCATH